MKTFTPNNPCQKFCSEKCKQKAYLIRKQRKPVALQCPPLNDLGQGGANVCGKKLGLR